MKSIKKILFIMAALAATLAFVSCSSGDDDPSTVAVYKCTEDGATVTITFYDDDTWKMVAEYEGEVVESGNGTYKGDPTKDGTITLTGYGENEEWEIKGRKLEEIFTRQ